MNGNDGTLQGSCGLRLADASVAKIQAHSYRIGLLVAFLALLAMSAIDVPHPDDFLLQHILTTLLIVGFVILEMRGCSLSHGAYGQVFIYLLLHLIGAHYTYTEVPYDQWWESIFDTSLSDRAGWSRNHYDRMVHGACGLLLLRPTSEILAHWIDLPLTKRLVVAAAVLFSLGTMYELLEWMLAALVGGVQADRYNGQQGDVFDAQKDLAWQMAGMCLAALLMATTHDRTKINRVSGHATV